MTTPVGPERIATGARIGRYEIVRRIALGGMAELYLAQQAGFAGSGRLVAIKRILPHLAEDVGFVKMFLNEARVSAGLDHSNIAHIIDFGAIDDQPFMVLEYVHGRSVLDILRTAEGDGGVPLACAVTIACQVADALHYAHGRTDSTGQPLGLVHRDVSPSNILVSFNGEVKLVDFGIAKATTGGEATTGGLVKGKLPYMAPEQARGEPVDRRTDIFALGVVLYELTVGERCFAAPGDFALLNRVVSAKYDKPSVVVPGFSPQLEAIIGRALQADPADRYPDALTFQRELLDFARDEQLPLSKIELANCMRALYGDETYPTADLAISTAVTEKREPDAQPTVELRPRRRARIALGAGLALGIGALGVSAWSTTWNRPQPTPESPPASPSLVGPVAMLPLANETASPLLESADKGLSFLLGAELEACSDLAVIDVYQLSARVGPGSSQSDWDDAARSLGARTLITGALAPDPEGVRVRLRADLVEGPTIRGVDVVVPERQVVATIHSFANALTEGCDRSPPDADADQALMLGIDALYEHRLFDARELLQQAVALNPDSGAAYYHLALAVWWHGGREEDVLFAIERARNLGLDDDDLVFLEGLGQLARREYASAISTLEVGVASYPEHRDLAYALFEALYHGGFPGRALEVHRRIVGEYPDFRLGLLHAFRYYLTHVELERLDSVLAMVSAADAMHWGALAKLVRGDAAAAARGLEAAIATQPLNDDALSSELMVVYLLADDIGAAQRLLTRAPHSAQLEYRLAIARGDDEADLRRIGRRAEIDLMRAYAERPRALAAVERVCIDSVRGEPAEQLEMLISRFSSDFLEGRLELAMARVIIDPETPSVPEQTFAEVAAMRAGFRAEARGDLGAAARAFAEASDLSADGRFWILERYHEARARRNDGDETGMLRACAAVIDPPVPDWTWVAAAPKCMGWAADAYETRGDTRRAMALRSRLERLRGPRPSEPNR